MVSRTQIWSNRQTQISCDAPTYVHDGTTYFMAAFGGVQFFVESSSDEFGRRGDVYEYPLSDQVGYKDLGRKARRFKVEGYLIGQDQLAKSRRMVDAVEAPADPENGTLLTHPLYGDQMVACVTLTTTADYRKDKKRTRLSFDCVEFAPSWAPFAMNLSISDLFDRANQSASYSRQEVETSNGDWQAQPTSSDTQTMNAWSNYTSNLINPPIGDEAAFDSLDYLARGGSGNSVFDTGAAPLLARAAPTSITSLAAYPTPGSFIDPISYGLATIRRLHLNALDRLKDFNRYVVTTAEGTPTVQALLATMRLLMIRDYAIVASRKQYDTVAAAIADLDFIMSVYDDEEAIATQKCNDALVIAIRQARAAAASAILQKNIRLPGIVESFVDGLWPSLVVAHKIYGDGSRYQQVENYNPTMSPFWMGRSVIAPAR